MPKIVTEADLEEAQRIAARLVGPEPRQRDDSRKYDAPATLDEVAAELGVTRQRVQQIERRALQKCAAWCAARGLSLEDLLRRR